MARNPMKIFSEQQCSFFKWWMGLQIFICLLLVPAALHAANLQLESSQYISSHWQTEDGLPNNQVQAICQTRDGYLWLATREGLVRFDGARFTVMDSKLFPETKNRSFTSLFESRNGTLWIASEDGRLHGLKDGKVSQLPLPATAANRLPMKIFESRDGALWIGTDTNGLVRFKDRTFTQITTKEGLAHPSVRSMCEDAEGNLWIATGAGVNRWNQNGITTFRIENGLLHNATRVVLADRKGNLWIASHFGLTRLKDGRSTHFTKNEGLSDNLISAIFEDRQGVLWIGTFNGLNRMVDGKLWTEKRNDGTPYDRVQSIFEDREGNLWVGTRDGLSRLRPRVVTSLTQQHGLTHNTATAVLEDRTGSLWVTFWGGGLNKIQDGQITNYTTREGLSSDLVLTVHETRRGNLWFGMDYDAGLSLFKDGQFTHFRGPEGLTNEAVKVILDDRQGNLWVGMRTALMVFKDKKFRSFTTVDGLPSNTIEAIHEDDKGRLWFGTTGGLAVLEDDRFKAITPKHGLSHPSITSIYEDAEHTLWLGTRGGGLNRFRDGKFSAYTTREGLFRDEIFSVVEDDLGFLWMSSRQGIFRVSKKDLDEFVPGKSPRLTCTSFGKADGMVSVECKGSGKTAGWKGKDGRLWYPTGRGVVAVDPRQVNINPHSPPVVIEELLVNGKSADISNPIQLTAEGQEFIFRYTALSLTAPEKIVFKYKLEGLDDDWIDGGNNREARYMHLPDGNYRFRVIAANSDSIWNEKGSWLQLKLSPPFWKTWWFVGLAGIAFVGITAGTVRYVSVKKLQRRLKLLEQQHAIEKERTRIAKDMHDDMGANLTQISILSELAKRDAGDKERITTHANMIADTARDLVQTMDGIVWAVNPKNDNLRRLAGYIFKYAEEFLALTSIRGRFDQPVSLPEYPLTAEVRHNVFLVVKEALNNTVKHSGATEVWIRLAMNHSALEISVEDNGRGFSCDMNSSFGNGLTNMKKRIEDIGGRFDLSSNPGGGTKIKLTVMMKGL